MQTEAKRPHYDLLDTVRGLCILSMVAYHGMYDLVDIIGLGAPGTRGCQGTSGSRASAGPLFCSRACAGSSPATT